MATEIHIWLLQPGLPTSVEEVGEARQTRWRDARWLPGLPSWWRSLWIWWRRRTPPLRALPDLQALPAARQVAETQAVRLSRILGPRYRCREVLRWPESELERAGRSLSAGDRVVLVPLSPLPDAAATGTLLEAAEGQLGRRRPVARVPDLGASAGVRQALVETVRDGLIDLGGEGPRPVVFSLRAGARASEAYADQAERLAQHITTASGLKGEAHLAFRGHLTAWQGPRPRVHQVLRDLRRGGHDRALVVPLDILVPDLDSLELLDKPAPEGLRVSFSPPPGHRPTMLRALADEVRLAEQRAGWT